MRCHNYLVVNDYINKRDRAVRFYYDDQWSAEAKNNKTFPKAQHNICKYQINNKVANVTSVPVALKCYSSRSEQDTDYLTHMFKYVLSEMKHEPFRNREVFESLLKGTAVRHIFFDDKKFGTYGDFVGGLREELIDFGNVACANPHNKDTQSQEWWIIRTKTPVGALKRMVKDANLKKDIETEVDDYDKKKEQPIDDYEMVWTYLRYYRRGAEVYHTLSTKKVNIYKDKPMNPNLNKVSKDPISKEWIPLPDAELKKNNIQEYQEVKFYLYPIGILTLNESDESIFGETELNDSVINTQKLINEAQSMQTLNLRTNAWDKYIVHPNALKNQVINDKGGQVLVDYSGTGMGIKRLGGMNAMANGVPDWIASLFDIHRTVTQTTDLYTGQTDNKDIAASALSQLNSQADKPVDVLRKRAWKHEEDMAKIIELFIRLYYTEQEYSYEMSESEKILSGANASNAMYAQETFNPDKLQGVKFHIVVEAIQGTKDSELIQENLVQTLFLNGTWNQMSYHDKEMYIEMSPLAQSIKDKMKALLKIQAQDEIARLQQENQVVMQQNQTLTSALNRAKEGISYLGSINRSLQNSYRNEAQAHQKDIQVRDKAVEQILTKEPDGKKIKA